MSNLKGIQHLGLPTTDMDKTLDFFHTTITEETREVERNVNNVTVIYAMQSEMLLRKVGADWVPDESRYCCIRRG